MTTGAAILKEIANTDIKIQPYRSGGFINKDYDMARITIDLPIIEAKKMLNKIMKYKGTKGNHENNS